ncbi:hypothetical protein T07_9862 [Trichinella nelsoni]|uniref:Uncharacterized protein n=1 Tax=Trichinella nelsoni TaxID=6336 RepID=A0A0V0RMY7_9BILA|nr:hypothetical protein T07_9862 [Trichinella nelsoni]
MAQYPELHLLPNRCGIWSNSDKEGCGGAVWTDLEVPSGIDRKDHVETCRFIFVYILCCIALYCIVLYYYPWLTIIRVE